MATEVVTNQRCSSDPGASVDSLLGLLVHQSERIIVAIATWLVCVVAACFVAIATESLTSLQLGHNPPLIHFKQTGERQHHNNIPRQT